MIRFPRPRRAPRHGRRILAALRPEPDPEPLDPCGNGPIDYEAARRRAITTVIATTARWMR